MSKSGMEHFVGAFDQVLEEIAKPVPDPAPERLAVAMGGQRVIKWYRKVQYGVEREFVHPLSKADGDIILRLTGKRTIDGVTRELFRDISGGAIAWEEVLAP